MHWWGLGFSSAAAGRLQRRSCQIGLRGSHHLLPARSCSRRLEVPVGLQAGATGMDSGDRRAGAQTPAHAGFAVVQQKASGRLWLLEGAAAPDVRCALDSNEGKRSTQACSGAAPGRERRRAWRSAPQKPTVRAASSARRAGAGGAVQARVWMSRMVCRPPWLGRGNSSSLSNLQASHELWSPDQLTWACFEPARGWPIAPASPLGWAGGTAAPWQTNRQAQP